MRVKAERKTPSTHLKNGEIALGAGTGAGAEQPECKEKRRIGGVLAKLTRSRGRGAEEIEMERLIDLLRDWPESAAS